jgi:hypothetical protein
MADKGKPKPTFEEIAIALTTESSRGFMLVASAWLEMSMRELLETTLKTAKRGRHYESSAFDKYCEKLLKNTTAKYLAELCVMFGHIGPERLKSLCDLFQIRNQDFAHWCGTVDLDSASGDRLAAFLDGLIKFEHPSTVDTEMFLIAADKSQPLRTRVSYGVLTIFFELLQAERRVLDSQNENAIKMPSLVSLFDQFNDDSTSNQVGTRS